MLARHVGVHLGVGVGHRKDDGVVGHGGHDLFGDVARGQADEHVCALECALDGATQSRPVAEGSQLLLDRGQTFPPVVDHALGVGDGNVSDTAVDEHLGDRHTGRPGTGDHNTQVSKGTSGEPGRVVERGDGHDRGAVLVVVEDGDVQAFTQPRLDLEATGSGDVLQVDTTEGR